MYAESFRFLNRASKNKNVRVESLELLKSFYDSGFGGIDTCRIKSKAIQNLIDSK